MKKSPGKDLVDRALIEEAVVQETTVGAVALDDHPHEELGGSQEAENHPVAPGKGFCPGHGNPGAGVGRVDLEGPEIDRSRPLGMDRGGKREGQGDQDSRKKAEDGSGHGKTPSVKVTVDE
jgi:hypothetical protein